MKKLLILILSLSMSVATFSSCFGSGNASDSQGESSAPTSSVEAPSSEVEEKIYKVTFVQDGQVVKTLDVKEGGAVAATDIPTPNAKVGYKVVWENVDLSNITADVQVKAVATANTYTITFDANGGETVASKTVTYDADFTLPTPVRDGWDFSAWVDADENAVTEGKWRIASDVTLKAVWTEVLPDQYTVSFVQDGQTIKSYTVDAGTNFTDIPTLAEKTGYTVKWDETALAKLSNVQETITVNAIPTPNTYTITYVDAQGIFKNTVDVTYDAAYDWSTLPSSPIGYEFDKFTLEDGTPIATSGVWKIADDTNVVVNWTGKKYTVVLNVGKGGTCAEMQIVVTYGEHYELPKVTAKDGYVFEGWKYNGNLIDLTGTWKYTSAGTIELTASYTSEEWTKNY